MMVAEALTWTPIWILILASVGTSPFVRGRTLTSLVMGTAGTLTLLAAGSLTLMPSGILTLTTLRVLTSLVVTAAGP